MTRVAVQLAVRKWWSEAACARWGSQWWFPEPGDPISAGVLSLCAGCPIRRRCLASALQQRERHGIWAGFAAYELDEPLQWLAAGEPLDPILDELLEIAADRPFAGIQVTYFPGPEPDEDESDDLLGIAAEDVPVEGWHAA